MHSVPMWAYYCGVSTAFLLGVLFYFRLTLELTSRKLKKENQELAEQAHDLTQELSDRLENESE